MNNGAGHFIQIGLCQAGFLRPAGAKTLHDLDFEIAFYLIRILKIFSACQTRWYLRYKSAFEPHNTPGYPLRKPQQKVG